MTDMVAFGIYQAKRDRGNAGSCRYNISRVIERLLHLCPLCA